MMEVLLVFGTRPEAIKMAPVVQALRAQPQLFRCCICVTAQHREMLDQVLRVFNIVPDLDLDVMTPDQGLTEVTCRVLERLGAYLASRSPACMLVHGDTTTTFAAAVAAFYQRIPVGHVEAGLRTGSPDRPFPEEMNRRLTGALARWHYAPTPSACANLLREGVLRDRIVVTGNTAIDAVRMRLASGCPVNAGGARFAPGRRGILVTAHRRELFGEGVRGVCQALRAIAELRPDVHLIYAVHQNPSVWVPVHEMLGGVAGITLVAPLGYDEFLGLMATAELILTDSGGIQEEAPSLGKPVLVLREATERPEAVLAGTVAIIGTDPETIVTEVLRLLDDRELYGRMARATNPYGDGFAAPRIVADLAARFGLPPVTLPVAREFSPDDTDRTAVDPC